MPLPLETARLIVRPGTEADAFAIARYYDENREHLGPYEPIRPPEHYLEGFWRERLCQDTEEQRADRACKLLMFRRAEPEQVVGTVSFFNFVRGAGHMATLGYGLDGRFQGQGLMHEALAAAIGYVFDELHFHRIQANYMPHNHRSARVLARLGFVREGEAKAFLRINGEWRDHVLTSLTNPNWRDAAF